MVRPARLALWTEAAGRRCTELEIARQAIPRKWDGAPCKTRTCDLLVRSQTLYPTELRARRVGCSRERVDMLVQRRDGRQTVTLPHNDALGKQSLVARAAPRAAIAATVERSAHRADRGAVARRRGRPARKRQSAPAAPASSPRRSGELKKRNSRRRVDRQVRAIPPGPLDHPAAVGRAPRRAPPSPSSIDGSTTITSLTRRGRHDATAEIGRADLHVDDRPQVTESASLRAAAPRALSRPRATRRHRHARAAP